MLTFSGNKLTLFSFTTCPATLKASYDGTEVAGIHKISWLTMLIVDSVSDCLPTILDGYLFY